MRRPILAMAATLAAAAFNQACSPEPLDSSHPGAAGSPGAAGTTGTGGWTGGTLGIGGGAYAGTYGMTCGAVAHPSNQIPTDILILLDASGSMNDDADNNVCNGGCGASSKWAQATAAINAVVAETDGTIQWGLKLFADDSTCGVGNGVAVPVGGGNAAAIASAIVGRTSANGGVANGSSTPTRIAESAATTYMQGLTDISPKFLLLVTDGAPNCMPGNVDRAADDSAGAVEAVTYAATAGFPTMVVGVATAGLPADATLNDMANAGGYPRAGSPSYYSVSNTAELENALRALIAMTPDCIFALPPAPNGVGYSSGYPSIGVIANGMEIPRDTAHANGWDFTSVSYAAVEVYGPVCDDYKAGKVDTISIVFHCLLQ